MSVTRGKKEGRKEKKSIIQRFLTCAARVSIDLVKIEPLFRLHKQLERHKKKENEYSISHREQPSASICMITKLKMMMTVYRRRWRGGG